jgi:hypothetical protein
MTVIKSVVSSDEEALLRAMQLHNNGQPLELDATYSKGAFYRGEVPEPNWKYDFAPELPAVKKADRRHVPFADDAIGSIVCDLPFMVGCHGTNNPANKVVRGYSCPTTFNNRFTQFASFEGLQAMYAGALDEFARILKPKGLLAFKCQDYTDKRTTMTHCEVWRCASHLVGKAAARSKPSNHTWPRRARSRSFQPGLQVAVCARCGAALSGTGRNSRAYYKLHYVR